MIETQEATVFVGATRRYFTKKSAQRSFAVAAIKRRCECDMGDHVTPPYFCQYHDYENGLFDKLVRRFVAINFPTSKAKNVKRDMIAAKLVTPEQLKARGIAA